eukprot:6208018-Pleurochrysis_carterae.AAC.1
MRRPEPTLGLSWGAAIRALDQLQPLVQWKHDLLFWRAAFRSWTEADTHVNTERAFSFQSALRT